MEENVEERQPVGEPRPVRECDDATLDRIYGFLKEPDWQARRVTPEEGWET
jgi:hypothetical protein